MKLAIDPGLCTGWAAFSCAKGQLVECGIGEPSKLLYSEAVCECPRVYPRSPVPPNDLITLAVQVGRYVERYNCRLIFPQEWKGQLPKAVCHARLLEKLTADEKAIIPKLAKSYLHNLLDAIGIGLYAFRGIRL